MRIGVLAAQGAFAEHIAVLQRLEVEAILIRLPGELEGVDGLIIPGGESTSISKLMRDYNLTGEIRNLAKKGLPIFGTCAGMIILANGVADPRVESLGIMNIKVKRNAFGRQKESFETEIAIPALGEKPFPSVFIRAPAIEQVTDGVEILARLPDDTIVASRQGRLLVSAFHPELTDDLRFHRYFLDIVAGD
ncbi:MAG: pyridoxal 5'-phosphate synthase glutaminase subunit PdxT [Chloroflexi bacterium]|nr:pyridoxal 5'-phosphate synthase glutaminase subunit PdxT [Chloroflexota bacterium]